MLYELNASWVLALLIEFFSRWGRSSLKASSDFLLSSLHTNEGGDAFALFVLFWGYEESVHLDNWAEVHSFSLIAYYVL
ncbi:hypothetical protein A4A49_18550 [Nicotiana attenuata]|uniref:Uncharacterized protein n=1 Tax=Nicotiana attenuata TaxID=49451 RepID=A0A1J6KG59_NICAT|nr:hypothetical protein A4A49_18550 [Nicotiana attenuata]